MFGATEDRALQLKARYRRSKCRHCSGSSTSSRDTDKTTGLLSGQYQSAYVLGSVKKGQCPPGRPSNAPGPPLLQEHGPPTTVPEPPGLASSASRPPLEQPTLPPNGSRQTPNATQSSPIVCQHVFEHTTPSTRPSEAQRNHELLHQSTSQQTRKMKTGSACAMASLQPQTVRDLQAWAQRQHHR
jgi:hypothetical protein